MITITAGNCGQRLLANTSATTLPTPKAPAPQSKCDHWGAAHKVSNGTRRPVSADSCDDKISNAAACVKPLRTGDVTKFSSQPKRTRPKSNCSMPARIAIQAASATHCALPGSAKPVSDAPMSRLVSAVGPTPSRVDELHSTATMPGNRDA